VRRIGNLLNNRRTSRGATELHKENSRVLESLMPSKNKLQLGLRTSPADPHCWFIYIYSFYWAVLAHKSTAKKFNL